MESNYNGGNPLALPEGTVLKGHLKVGKVLGAGGFGITYLAEDKNTHRRYALKEYVPLGLCYRKENSSFLAVTSSEKWEPFEHGKLRFREEAELLRELRGIPGVVQIFDDFEANGTAYYMMEYLAGYTVRQLQKMLPEKKIGLTDAVNIILEVGIGLEQVHRQRHLLHRDISPDNIMCTKNGEIRLIDFGNAKHLSQEHKNIFSVVLKPGYAPPEQYGQKKEQGVFTDEYSLAGTFYCMVTGKMPPDAMDRVGGGIRLVPMNEYEVSVPVAVWKVVEKAMNLNAEARYISVGSFLEALDQAYKGSLQNGDRLKESDKTEPNRDHARDKRSNSGFISVRTGLQEELIKPFLELYVENGSNLKWYLPADMDIRIGRASNNNIVLNRQTVSKNHCTIRYDSATGNFLVKDHSSNGTKIGNQKLNRDVLYSVPPENILILADSEGMQIGVENGSGQRHNS